MKEKWIYEGDFTVTEDMVSDGKFIEGTIPDEVTGDFSCSYNNLLTSLEGGPELVGKSFYCNFNSLTSLEGAPELVGKSFNCSDNNLTSLEGSPKIGKDFDCSNNLLTSLKGGPESVGGSFYCSVNINDLIIEAEFIKSGNYKRDYYLELLKWMIKINRNINDIKTWPKGFLDNNLGRSAINIGKFNL